MAPTELSPTDICARIKKMGYGLGGRIHLYGERMEVLSDPFLKDGLIAIKVRSASDSRERVIYFPATVLQSVRKQSA